MGDARSRLTIFLFLLVWGIFMMSEGLNLTSLGEKSVGTPDWIVTLAGFSILIVGLMMMIKGEQSRWKDLLAAIFCGAMGLIGGWVSLFSPAGSISGPIFLDQFLGVPTGRIVFGAGAVISLLIAVYALKLFLSKSADMIPE